MKPFTIAQKDPKLVTLIAKTDHKTLARWTIDCAKRVLPFFEKKYPADKRPRIALETLQQWIRTGVFSMRVIRKASLDSHAAARDVGEDTPARSAARASGQAVATAHVRTHAIGAAQYALQALARTTPNSEQLLLKERLWQYKQLLQQRKKASLQR